jgi:hypothetical protein
VSNEAISNEHIQAGVAAGNSNLGNSDGIEMAKVDSESDPVGARLSQTHTGDNEEYFEVEAIKSCKLGSRVRRFSGFFIFILTIIFF